MDSFFLNEDEYQYETILEEFSESCNMEILYNDDEGEPPTTITNIESDNDNEKDDLNSNDDDDDADGGGNSDGNHVSFEENQKEYSCQICSIKFQTISGVVTQNIIQIYAAYI